MYEYLGSLDDSSGYVDDARRVVAIVAAAFEERPPITGFVTRDPGGFDQRSVEADLSDCRWQDISIETVAIHKDDLAFLTAEAFAYFLPAFIVASIKEPDLTDVAMQSTLWMLTPLRNLVPREDFGFFSSKEVAALRAFVAFVGRWFPELVSEKLVAFWSEFSGGQGSGAESGSIALPRARPIQEI